MEPVSNSSHTSVRKDTQNLVQALLLLVGFLQMDIQLRAPRCCFRITIISGLTSRDRVVNPRND